MAEKRKISIRKILQVFVTLVVTGGCIVAVLGASVKQQKDKIGEIHLHIKNEKQYQFLDKKALLNDIIVRRNIIANRTPLSKLNVKSIEAQAYRNPWVAEAQVYVDNQKDMHIYVTQRVPVARVFFESGQSCYLDTALNLLPLSDLFSYYTTVVTNVPWYNNDSMNTVLRGEIVSLVQYIDKRPFWKAQIEQVSVTPDRKFELYPLLGTQKIIFGDTTGMSWKFDNLFAFYKGVLNRIGWDKYELIDVRFRDQIVASPSLPWKMPPKNAMSNMNWLKSILDAQPKTDTSVMKEAIARNNAGTTQPDTAHKAITPKPKQEQAVHAAATPKPAAKKPEVKPAPALKPAAPKPEVKKEVKKETKKETAKKPAAKTETKAGQKQTATPKYIYQKKENQ